MKFYQFIVFFLLVSFSSSAQVNKGLSGVVKYTYYRDLGKPAQDSWDLIFEADQSIFQLSSGTAFSQDEGDSSKNVKQITLEVDKKLTPHLIHDFRRDSIYSQGLVFRDPYYVQDEIFHPEWNLHKEQKEIAGFVCQKATTHYRGREYQVWFAPEIPVNFGPWKLNGLPGLILEARDQTGQIEFLATQVSINLEIDIEAKKARLPKLGPRISLKDYVEKKDNEGNEISRYITSRMSRSRNSSSNFEPAGRETQIEITYEWEKSR